MIKQYEKYKDSGISWMGVIPTHWMLTKAKYCSSFRMGQTILKEEVIEDGEFPVFSATEGDHYFGRINNPSFVLEPGDIVIPARGNSIGHIALVYEKAVSTQTTIASFIDRRKINCNFLYYFYKGFRNTLFHYDVTAIPQITVDQVKQNPIVLPPLEEQTKIAHYLDHQTAIIDQLIHQKEKLIELLKEKRQAVINEAVTKGLDPNVKMKDSEIEWLGRVPSNWDIIKLKHVVEMKSGNFISAELIEDEGLFPIYGGNGIRGYNSKYSHEGFFPLIGRQGALCGNINYANGKFWPTEHAVVVSPKKKVDIYWIGELLRIMNLNQYSQASAQPGLSVEKILNLRIPFPGYLEQNEIALKLKSLNEKFELANIELGESISKLKEYRQSIISEAVTGKIDVSNWQPNKQKVA